MNITRARELAKAARQNVGALLNLIRNDKSTDAVGLKPVRCELLSMNSQELHRLYQEFPAIKPVRVRQLNLFRRAS